MNDDVRQQRACLALQVGVSGEKGCFEILAITAGIGNGWEFGAEALHASLDLWANTEVFVDHAWSGRSIRDLAGVCSEPRWDESVQGVRLKLKPLGPGAEVLSALGRAVLDAEVRPKVGFSADVLFTSEGRKVKQILRVYSVDLVYNPARGGEFVRALNALSISKSSIQSAIQKEDETMGDEKQLDLFDGEAETPAETGLRGEMCACLLETALAAARLPQPAARQVRERFAGRIFAAAELTAALDSARDLVAQLTASEVVQGPGRVQSIHGMFDSRDQLQCAVDDLFEAPRSKGMEGLAVSKLTGIRELYMLLTGDYDLHGGYYRENVQLATTADFAGLVKNALNKMVINTWELLGRAGYDWWQPVCTVEHFNSLQTITGTLVGTVGPLPAVAEGGDYTELAVGDSPETAAFSKYGGYIPLTLELIDRDDTRKLKAYPRELASAGLRKISALVAGVFTANAGAGPVMADGGSLFNATAANTPGGHANLLTTALSAAQWEVVSKAVYNQPMLVKNAAGFYGAGPKMAINPRYLLVPRDLQLAAKQIVYPTLERATQIVTENQQQGQPGDVVTVPDWTDANDWAAVCDPLLAPAIFVGERFGIMPEVFVASSDLSPAVFMNDECRLKVRHFLAVWVNDFRPLHKENVP